nr:glycosyltransferase [Peribacillus sp. TH27]
MVFIKNRFLKLMILFMSFALIFSPLTTEAKGKGAQQRQCISKSSEQLKHTLQKLWIDHTIWTRSYMVSALSDLDDKEKVLTRLLKNQDDIGNAIKPYYGDAAGNKLAELLREHIVLAGKVVDAAKSGNQENLKIFNAEWYKNADDIALFLSKANPNWSNDELKELLYTHLKLLTDQVVSRIKKDTDAEISAFDKGEDHIIKLADTLTEGIIKQFPKKF